MAVHPTAIVSPGARLGAGVTIGPYAVIEDGAEIGDNTEIRAHAVIKRFTTIGQGNQIHEGAILGGEPQDLGFKGGETRLQIGNGNKIREHVTIHRASKENGVTTVGNECFLMANVHIAHDCQIGDQAILANNTALAGHVEIGPRAFLSGGVLVHQFSSIGRLAMIGGHSSVRMDCLPFITSDGDPARAVSLNLVGLRRAGLSGLPGPHPQGGLPPAAPPRPPPGGRFREDGRPPGPPGGRDGGVRQEPRSAASATPHAILKSRFNHNFVQQATVDLQEDSDVWRPYLLVLHAPIRNQEVGDSIPRDPPTH